MKKLFSTIMVALVATVASYAQTISVVSPTNITTMHQDLDDAIAKADPGSVIYLPGGGFQISDETKITKKLTIIGVSHRADTDNAEGATTIAGNLFFEGGSDGSAVMGVYVSGRVNLGEKVSRFTMRYCNVGGLGARSGCMEMVINQCYLRGYSNFGHSNPKITHCIVHSLGEINGGTIDHNIIRHNERTYLWHPISWINNSRITNNFFLEWENRDWECSNNIIFNNCIGNDEWGDNPVKIGEGKEWKDVFDSSYERGVNVTADYHLISEIGKNAGSDGKHIGIYLNDNNDESCGFDDKALAPIPRIVSKKISEQTDAEGKLNIQVTVKAK